MMKVVGVTISLDIKNNNMGTGSSRFVSMKAEESARESEIPLDDVGVTIPDAMVLGFDMLEAAYKTILSAQLAQCEINKADYEEAMSRLTKRSLRAKTMMLSQEGD